MNKGRRQDAEICTGWFLWEAGRKVLPLASVMTAILRQKTGNDVDTGVWDAPEEPGKGELFVMSNTKGINGFSAVLYPEALKDFAGIAGKNLYVLPSSVHEALLFPEDTAITPKELQEMVAEVNASPAVAEEDILSDSLYYYDREKNELRMAEGCICAG